MENYGFGLILLCVIHGNPSSAQIQFPFADAWGMALGGATAGQTGRTGLFYNPASLQSESSGFILNGLIPYAGLELKGISGGVYSILDNNHAGAGFTLMGDPLYQYSIVSLTYARTIGDFSVGMRPEWHREAIFSSLTISNYYLTAGSHWQVVKNIRAGAYFRRSFSSRGSPYGSELTLGGSWSPSKELEILIEWKGRIHAGHSLIFAMVYSPDPRLRILTGWRINPSRWHAGLSFTLGKKTATYAIAIDPLLGQMHAFSMGWAKEDQ